MADDNTAPVGGESITPPADAPATFSTRDAAKMLADIRWKRDNPEPDASANPAADPEPAQVDDAPLPEPEAPSDTIEGDPDPADDLPPIEPPRSWSKEDK